jgi:hypothetical protein
MLSWLDSDLKQSIPGAGRKAPGTTLNGSLVKENATKLLTKMIKGSGFREMHVHFYFE